MTESERLQIQDRARKAKELLDSEVITEAFVALERANMDALLSLAPSQDVERRDFAARINAIRAVRGQLHEFVTADTVQNKPVHKIA